jgi:hypothetical protein
MGTTPRKRASRWTHPEAAICKARLDQQGENLLDLNGDTVSTKVIDQSVSFSPA